MAVSTPRPPTTDTIFEIARLVVAVGVVCQRLGGCGPDCILALLASFGVDVPITTHRKSTTVRLLPPTGPICSVIARGGFYSYPIIAFFQICGIDESVATGRLLAAVSIGDIAGVVVAVWCAGISVGVTVLSGGLIDDSIATNG